MDEFPNFPANSRETRPLAEAKPIERRAEQIVEGRVVVRKRSTGTRFRQMFFGADTHNVFDIVGRDVLIPAAKDMVADALRETVERMIFGEARDRRTRSSGSRSYSNPPPVNYNRYSSSTRDDPRSRDTMPVRRSRSSRDLDEIILDSRVEADLVLERLDVMLEKYKVVTVGDLYDLLGVAPQNTDEKWGWYDLRGSRPIRHRRGGYLLSLPQVEPIDSMN
jgi:hypothetical protein